MILYYGFVVLFVVIVIIIMIIVTLQGKKQLVFCIVLLCAGVICQLCDISTLFKYL
jgi:hypothetical protein